MSKELVSYPDISWDVGRIPTGKRIAVDTETTGLNPYTGDMAFMFSFANEEGDVTVVPREMEYDKMLREFFLDTSITKVFHNAKFDIKMIRSAGFDFPDNTPIADTIVMAKLVNENEISYRLKYLCKKYFKYSAKEDALLDEYKKKHKVESYDEIPTDILYPYAAVDAWNCMLLFHLYIKEVGTMRDMYVMDMKCLKYLIEMEDRGVLINKRKAKEIASVLKKENNVRQTELKEETGVKLEPSNKRLLGYAIWASGGDVKGRTESGEPLLDKATLPLYSPDISWMPTFIEFKKTDKVIADLNKQIIGNLDSKSVLHTSFNLSQARTGRFSSSGPNLQNINKKSRIREVFIPRPGYELFYFDYSQIEYRLYAYFVQDQELIEGYNKGTIDMHSKTARENTDGDRDQAKTVNFMILYGGGAPGLSAKLGVELDEAKAILESFHATNPKLKELEEMLLVENSEKDYIQDPFGKQYHLTENDYHKAVNTLIQGTACNVLKQAMLNIKQLLKDYDAHLIQNIHDELIFEVKEGDYAIIPLIKEAMEDIPQIDGINLAVDVEYSSTNWGEKTTFPKELLEKWTTSW